MISVIIPVYRDWHRLSLCLSALERQSLPADLFEIVVANNEADQTSTPARLPANARVIHEPRPGSYAARNSAVAASEGRYLAFTDSDCVPKEDWLERGLAAMEANPGARIAGAVSLFREEDGGYYAFLYELHTAFPQRDYVASGVSVTANLFVPREVFHRIGAFEERLSGGDVEWGSRAFAAGYPVLYDESVRVGHPARRNLAEIFRKRRRTAGSAPIDIPVHRFVLERMKPPLRRFVRLLRKDVSLKEATIVMAIHWMGRLVEAQEFSLVRLGLKSPNRQ